MTPVREALANLLRYVERNECAHESRRRGGAIWTICDDCGRKWADDRGGFIPYSEPSEITAAREALTAAPGEPCAWVKRLADNWRGRRDSLTGDSVRDSCADELEKVAACHATPQPAAGRSNDKRNIIQDAIIRCPSFSDLHRAPDLCAYDLADDIIKALRREAPAPADLSYVSQLIAENNELKDQLAARHDTAEARLREFLEQIKSSIDTRLNNVLCEMKPDYDDSIVGFNEAWDIVRKFLREKIESLSPPSGGDEAKESEGGCICQDQHRRGYCTEPGCPYAVRPSEPSPPADAILVALDENHKNSNKA